jgi:hypothetical protein
MIGTFQLTGWRLWGVSPAGHAGRGWESACVARAMAHGRDVPRVLALPGTPPYSGHAGWPERCRSQGSSDERKRGRAYIILSVVNTGLLHGLSGRSVKHASRRDTNV